jgi:hypothetical protein
MEFLLTENKNKGLVRVVLVSVVFVDLRVDDRRRKSTEGKGLVLIDEFWNFTWRCIRQIEPVAFA